MDAGARAGDRAPGQGLLEFDEPVTVSDPRGVPDLTALDQIYKWIERSSRARSPSSSVHAAIGGAYRLAADHDASSSASTR